MMITEKRLWAIITHYKNNGGKRAEAELKIFRNQPSIVEAIYLAALGNKPNGKRFDHQREIPRIALCESKVRLIREIERLKSVNSFKDLYNVVDQIIGSIKGIGELTTYDTALRIGAKLGLEPQDVYLHAGTREGACKLGIKTKERYISIEKIPEPLRSN